MAAVGHAGRVSRRTEGCGAAGCDCFGRAVCDLFWALHAGRPHRSRSAAVTAARAAGARWRSWTQEAGAPGDAGAALDEAAPMNAAASGCVARPTEKSRLYPT